jgi:tRNA1(Val) A37 N6-methylase TrmN6
MICDSGERAQVESGISQHVSWLHHMMRKGGFENYIWCPNRVLKICSNFASPDFADPRAQLPNDEVTQERTIILLRTAWGATNNTARLLTKPDEFRLRAHALWYVHTLVHSSVCARISALVGMHV